MAAAVPASLDFTRPDRVYLSVRLDLGGGPEELEVTEPSRALAERLGALPPGASLGELYAAAAAVLSRNARGRRVTEAEAEAALTVAECLRVLRAYGAARAAALAELAKN